MTDLVNKTSIAATLDRVTATYSDAELTNFWYDWFCKQTSLPNKSRKLLAKLRSITPSPRFDATKTYVWFKNNCPVNGKLYDDFRIADIETGETLYCVVPANGHKIFEGLASVWGKAPDTGDFEELVNGDWTTVKSFFTYDDATVLGLVKEHRRANMIDRAERENKQMDRDAKMAREMKEWKAQNEAWAAERKRDENSRGFVGQFSTMKR